MRIGFVSTYPPIECGIATYTDYLNEALRTLENETFVISQLGAQGQGVFPVFKAQSQSFASDVYTTSVNMTPDIMHIQHEYGLYGTQRGVEIVELILRYRLAQVPVVITLHTVYSELKRDEQIILKHVLDECSAVIVHEEFQRETLLRYFGDMPRMAEKIRVIEHGIREMGPVPDAKKKLGLEGKKVILLCGYFRPTKGYHKIVDCFSRIAEQDEDAVLVVAGKTRNVEYDEYRRKLFLQLNESPFVDRIEILRGQFPQHTFDTIISAADVVVLPYEVGAQSGMMAQCFAAGVPVITSDLPAFRIIIERSGGGLVCEKDEDYPETILRALNDRELADGMKKNIRQYVSEKAGWSQIAQQHIDAYHSGVTVPYGKARYVYFHESGPETKGA